MEVPKEPEPELDVRAKARGRLLVQMFLTEEKYGAAAATAPTDHERPVMKSLEGMALVQRVPGQLPHYRLTDDGRLMARQNL